MNSHIISAIGSDRPGIVSKLTGIITNHGGNIEESRMTRLGSDFVIFMLVSLDPEWEESLVVSLQAINNLSITTKKTDSNTVIKGKVCKIELNGADNEGIVNVLSNYLSDKSMNIQDMDTHISNAPVTGTPLFNLKAITALPENLNLLDIQSELNHIAQKLSVEIMIHQAESILDTL